MSTKLYGKKREDSLVAGVNSPVRSFKEVGSESPDWVYADGAYLVDSKQRNFLDYVMGFGPILLGHSHMDVVKDVQYQAKTAMIFGGNSDLERQLAEKIIMHMPSVEKIRFNNSGTEAVNASIRLARSITKREKIIKFDGHYHGSIHELLHAKSAADQEKYSSNDQTVLTARYNDLNSVESLLKQHGDDVAAVLIEPIAGNMSMILPEDGFLADLAVSVKKHGALLICDEVMTGFRVGLSGAQGRYGITPDLTVFGKVIGGGLPVGAVGGKAEYMDYFAPKGPVYQAGTFAGNPMTMRAGLSVMHAIEKNPDAFYDELEAYSKALCGFIDDCGKTYGIAVQTCFAGGMMGLFFTEKKIKSFDDTKHINHGRFKQFFNGCMSQGVFFPPSAMEAFFISKSHREHEMQYTKQVIDQVFASMR